MHNVISETVTARPGWSIAAAAQCLLLCSVVLSLAAPAVATDRLDSVVITGTRSERQLIDVPVRTEVVSRAELQRTHARDVGEALRNAPGVLLREIHGKNGKEVWLQGMDSDRVLVLIDGRPVSASTGSTVNLAQITTGDVERIEIVKGAVSALYGSSAMGGVVNVITRENTDPLAARLQLDAGTFGDKGLEENTGLDQSHLVTGFSASSGTVGGAIDIDVRQLEGFELDDTTYLTEGGRGTRATITGHLDLKLTPDTDVGFRSSWYEEDLDRDFVTFAPGVGEIEKLDGEQAERFTQLLSFDHAFNNGMALSTYAMRETFDDDTQQDIVATDVLDQQRFSEIATNKAEWQLDIPQGAAMNWTVGGVFHDADLSQNQERIQGSQLTMIEEITPGADRQSVELFAQNDIFVGERWEWVPGVRYQDDSDFGSHIAPKINVMYTPDATSKLNPRLRLGVGAGYRVPNLKERFFLFDHSVNGYVVLGNPALQPEESLSFQAGVEVGGNGVPLADLTVFWNDFEDLIETSRDAQASGEQQLDVFRYTNVGAARTYGLDTRLSMALTARVDLNLAYSWLDAENRDSGNRLTRRPEHQWQAGIDWRLPGRRTELTLRGTRQSSEFIDSDNQIRSPGFNRLDVKLNQPIGRQTRVFLGIDNLTDATRNPGQGGSDLRPLEGRFVYTGVSFEY